ncbi:MAG: diguanylate cyclase [Sedimenticola sp.]
MELEQTILRAGWLGGIREIPRCLPDAIRKNYILRILFCTLILALLYFFTGLFSLAAESAQSGITPIWLPSGVAFAAFYFFGIRLWPGVFLGMYLIALSVGIPVEVATAAALGSVLEAAVPVAVLRYLGFRPELDKVKAVLAFALLGVTLGPMISASLGVMGFSYLMGGLSAPASNLWLFWWLGNAIGIVTLGGFLLAWGREWKIGAGAIVELLLLSLALVYSATVAVAEAKEAVSVLFLFLGTPLLLLAGIRHGARGVTLLGLALALTFLVIGAWINPDCFRQADITYLFLDVAYVGVGVFTGLIVAAAFAEQRHYQFLHIRANYDYLTELLNRAAFMDRMAVAMEAVEEQGASHCLLYLDLDGVKLVNDTASHEAGDHLIRSAAETIKRAVRQRDCAARMGGDEFAVLLWHCPLDRAHRIADEICREISGTPFTWDEQRYEASISIGGTVMDAGSGDIQAVVNRADAACYQAKHMGGGRVVFPAG